MNTKALNVMTVAFCGVQAHVVEVQLTLSRGLPAFAIVGLPDKAVAESRERVRSALLACGLALPSKRITINLAPADLPKEGSHFDLPIALAIMAALEALPSDALQDMLILGELALDGRILPVSGVLPAAVTATSRRLGLVCPAACGGEAAWAGEDLTILAPQCLLSFANHINGTQVLTRPVAKRLDPSAEPIDLGQVRGQEFAKRSLEVAAAGSHNLLLNGPPGTGKSLLASCLPTLLPPPTPAEQLDIGMIASLAGAGQPGGVSGNRPFRSPHHSATTPALIGGGRPIRPGEVTLAHHGVLFLDELPEFSVQSLDALRQPLEQGIAYVSRANQQAQFPARFQLVAAMNPCRCGYATDPARICRQHPRCAQDYQNRVSGPLMDRIDLHVEMPPPAPDAIFSPNRGESSATVAARVRAARTLQAARYHAEPAVLQKNATCPIRYLEPILHREGEATRLLREIVGRFRLSTRALHRILRVSRTLADLIGGAEVGATQVAEAAGYRIRQPTDSPPASGGGHISSAPSRQRICE